MCPDLRSFTTTPTVMQLAVVGFRSSCSLKCDEYQMFQLKLHITVQLGFGFFEELRNVFADRKWLVESLAQRF